MPATIEASAELISPTELAFARFRERIEQLEQTKDVKFTHAKGVQYVQELDAYYTVNLGGEAHNPARDTRRLLSPISGRQWRKFRKALRRMEKQRIQGAST